MRRTSAFVLALLLLPIASPAAPGPAPVAVAGPDDEGAFLLSYDVTRASAGAATLRLLVHRDGEAQGVRDLGTRELPAGTTRVELPFLPAEGEGAYAVALDADGAAGEPLRFAVDDAAATARVTWVVPEAPTRLLLADDAVNADGKLKSPGDALLTRVRVEDANGMADVGPLRWFVLQGATLVDSGEWPLPAPGNATSASVEHRYARVPMPAGEYALGLRAKDAEVRRTFAIRDVPATLAPLALGNVTPDADVTLRADATLADRNGWPERPALEARAYRGTVRLAWPVTLSAPIVAGENATAPLDAVVPAGAAPGPYRVSFYVAGTFVASAGFDVLPLPRLANATAEPTDDALTLRLDLTAPALADLRVWGDGAWSQETRALPAGNSTVVLAAPGNAPVLRWNVTLRAREGGPGLAHAEGEWRRDAPRPALDLQPLRLRTPLAWSLAAPGWDLANATVAATLARWDGQAAPANATFDGARLVVDAAGLEPGRYVLAVAVALPNGTRAAAQATFDLAPWVRVTLGEAVLGNGTATVSVHNAGAAVRGLVVEVDGLPEAPTLQAGGASHAARSRGARHVFDAPLAAGEDATLTLRLPQGPMPAGAHEARVRVLALGGRP